MKKEVNALKHKVEELKKNETDTSNKVTSLSEQFFEISNTLKDIVNKMKCMKSDNGYAMNKIQYNQGDDDKSCPIRKDNS